MTFKKIAKSFIALCVTAILAVAVCGCDDLGAYDDTEDYYASFGDIVLIEGTSREENSYSVEEYFYNKESREDFLEGEDGVYSGVEHSDYVYMAIPVERELEMDSLALYIKSEGEGIQTLCISVYLTDTIPSDWKAIGDPDTETVDENGETVEKEIEYDDPDPETAIAEKMVYLDGSEWDSFTIESFKTEGASSPRILLTDGQYILLQFRNNSGVLKFNEEDSTYVDEKTGLPLEKITFTTTNLLIRSVDDDSESDSWEEE